MQIYSDFLKNLLEKRGIIGSEQIEFFLNPNYERDLHDPFLMRDMEKVCKRIFQAINQDEKIIIYADYDCDGIPGAVILSDLFKKINYQNYEVYIPQRNSEGYGLNIEAIKKFAEKKIQLLITIDLGITAVKETALANELGIDVIITDHHLPPEILPNAFAILNPKIDNYPEKMLCGAGVMFKFTQGFLKKYGENFKIKNGAEKWFLDMSGIATLSDMVPLLGENRALAYFGLKVLRKSPRPGLQKLLTKTNINQKFLTEDDLGFTITPRLNAASRMDNPQRAFELLSTTNEIEADQLVEHLTKINDERKKIVINIMREVNKKFEDENRILKEVIVIGNPNWKLGVLGLVAGKICEKYKKPVFVWSKDENSCIKGSCRSDGSISVVKLMNEVQECFMGYGGHEASGGFTVHNEQIHSLEENLCKKFLELGLVAKQKSRFDLEGAQRSNLDFCLATKLDHYDLKINLNTVNMQNYSEIEKMGPFGLGNPKPIFLFEKIKIEKIKKFGKNNSQEHLEIIFSEFSESKFSDKSDFSSTNKSDLQKAYLQKTVKAISFFYNPESFQKEITNESEGNSVNLLANFDLSLFGGKKELRLKIIDIF
ncbi:MAG: single-stranded-DNA-specific exonuclease RecJ [Patescibacteria group bacterium]